jgi:hypothetical protein
LLLKTEDFLFEASHLAIGFYYPSKRSLNKIYKNLLDGRIKIGRSYYYETRDLPIIVTISNLINNRHISTTYKTIKFIIELHFNFPVLFSSDINKINKKILAFYLNRYEKLKNVKLDIPDDLLKTVNLYNGFYNRFKNELII